MHLWQVIAFLFCAIELPGIALEGERLFYLSNGEVLQGCVYKPQGDGPFPAVVFNQPATKAWPESGRFDPFPALAKFYTSHNYILFIPGRTKLTASDESESLDESKTGRAQKRIRQHEQRAEIIFAGIETLKAQAYVKPRRIYVTGYASGGTTSLFLAQQDLEVCGYVIFSPAVEIWDQQPAFRSVLTQAVKNAKVPIFLIQTKNDSNLGPIEVLGKELEKKGAPNRMKTFPAYGTNPRQGNGFAITAPDIWGSHVLSFFDDVLN